MLCDANKTCYIIPQYKQSAIGYSKPRLNNMRYATRYIVISRSKLRDRDWSNTCYVMCKNKQHCPVSSLQCHVPGEHCANHVTSCICIDFLSNCRSIYILCCWVMDDDTNLLHLFRDITKQILTVSLDQHWKIMPRSCAILPSGLGQHFTTEGHYFSMLSLEPVNICTILMTITYIHTCW